MRLGVEVAFTMQQLPSASYLRDLAGPGVNLACLDVFQILETRTIQALSVVRFRVDTGHMVTIKIQFPDTILLLLSPYQHREKPIS